MKKDKTNKDFFAAGPEWTREWDGDWGERKSSIHIIL
jgi:hypothetical protein